MHIAIAADSLLGVATSLVNYLRTAGHQVTLYGALESNEPEIPNWAPICAEAARQVAIGEADCAIVCCTTGTGASIAANKIPGIRAALCADAYTAMGARKWNDANVLALSLRSTSEEMLYEILGAWFSTSFDLAEQDNVDFLNAVR